MYLLDANVLIALGQRNHVHHQRARSWFFTNGEAWATCPLTENAFIRILGHGGYEDFEGGADQARLALEALVAIPGHQFWPDEVSLVRATDIPRLPVCCGYRDC